MRFQEHELNLDINIKEVFLKAKAPSSLSFQITTDGKVFTLRNHSYPLENDHCLVYEHCELNVSADFDNNSQTYTPKQVTITLFLQQDSGSSVVGIVKFNPFEARFQVKDWEVFLQNTTQDARISFSSRLTIISKKERLPTSGDQLGEDPYSMRKQKKQVKESKRYSKKSSANQLIMPESKIKLKQSFHSQKFQEVDRQINKTKKLQIYRSTQLNRKVGASKALSPKIAEQTIQKERIYDEVEKLKKRIQQERAQKVRSISKLKVQLNPKLTSGQSIPNNSDMGRLKEKIRNLQKKEKNLQISVEDLMKELERSKEKQAQLEKKKEELQRTIGEKDIKLRAANNTIRNLNEQIDSLNSRERIVSKKGEVKENIFRDQTKRLQERLKQAEVEINEAISQKNATIQKIADLEKKHQSSLKERDFKLNEEKAKNLKLREDLINQQRQLELKLEELTLHNENITKMNICDQEKIHELQIIIRRFESQSVQVKQTLKAEREKSSCLVAQFQKNQGHELINQKKKYNQLNALYLALRDSLKKTQSQVKQYQGKVKLLEENLKTKGSENQQHIARINTFQKELDSVKQESNRKSTEIDHLKASVGALNEKVAELRDKLQNEKNRREDANYQLQKNATMWKQQRDSLEAEISEFKWGMIKNNDIIDDLQRKIKTLNEEIMKNSEEIMVKAQRIITFEENIQVLTIQNERLNKERHESLFKLRETAEVLKHRQAELEEERRKIARLEQKYEEERQRAAQLELSWKNRESLDDKKQKQRDQLARIKVEQCERLEVELFKKKEEVLTLKANVELTLREIQLAKNDYDGAKSELNILRSEHNTLKEQLQAQTVMIDTLSSNLAVSKQQLTLQLKRQDSLKAQHEQYRSAVKSSFENLVGEFFKEQASSNVIATTLIPFPDQSLSALQLQLVQKRNTFIIRQKQTNAVHEQQISALENQLKQMKALFQSRENALKNNENEQRQKLKTLLYEGMLEKNYLTEELTSLTQQRQQLLREVQRLRRQIIGREENEQQLNGQLHILLLEHDTLKAENQDLSNLIFKYREEEIRIKGEYEQQQLQNEQHHNGTLEKANLELVDKEKKIIALEKDIMELHGKVKAVEADKNHSKEQLEAAAQKIREIEYKLAHSQSQVTKLNNTIRNYEKVQLQSRQVIEKLENEIKKAHFKEDTQNINLSRVQEELTQSIIQREKLNGQILNLKERLEELQRLLSQKGEISKEKLEKKMEENAQLKTKLIEKESQLSIKEFYLKQKDQSIATASQQKQENKATIASLKTKIKELNLQKQTSQSRIRQLGREVERLQGQLRKAEDLLGKSNYTIMAMESELELMQTVEQHLKQKQQECLKLRQQKAEKNQASLREIKKYQQQITTLKKELEGERGQHRAIKEEHRVAISRTESSNTERYNHLLFELQQERDEFSKRVEEIETHNKSVIAELQSKIQEARVEIQDLKDNEKVMQDQLAKKESQLTTIKKKHRQAEQALEQIKQKYNRYYLLYEESKSQIQQMIKSQEEKTSKIIKDARVNMLRSLNQKLFELSRKIERLKYAVQMNTKGDSFSRKEFLAQFNHIFSKLREYLLESEERESDSFEVRRERGTEAI